MADTALFPVLTPESILAFQFSSWYPTFAAHSIKSTIVRPLSAEFREYLNADGVFVPEGSEDAPAESTLSDDEKDDDDNDADASDDDDEDEDEEAPHKHYAFPALDAQIRACVKAYGGVFPKLNFTAPRDAAWLLPASSPLKCTSPADVYLLLKSSDFVTHDLSPAAVFEGTVPEGSSSPSVNETAEKAELEILSTSSAAPPPPPYELELVLRKWYPVDRSRELRCFVRDGVLLAISQRDTNFYEFWNERGTQARVRGAVQRFWDAHVRQQWPVCAAAAAAAASTSGQAPAPAPTQDYIFDLLLTRDLSRGHILDFNPYAPKTDPLLFSYEELAGLLRDHRRKAAAVAPPASSQADSNGSSGGGTTGQEAPDSDSDSDSDAEEGEEDKEKGPGQAPPGVVPVLRVIDSAAHPAAASNAPAHQHNMIPFEAVSLSSGRDIEEFADQWKASVKESMRDVDES